MNLFIQKLLYRANRFYWYHFKKHQPISNTTTAQEASDIIYDYLVSDKPCLIGRLGGTELKCALNYLGIKQHPWAIADFIRCKCYAWWWTKQVIDDMKNLSGFFPNTPENLAKFSELFLEDIKQIDVLGSWLEDESFLQKDLEKTEKVPLIYLEPYHAAQPWSRILKGKRVLVIHPFAKAIKNQYTQNRTKLFSNPEVLPEFDLKVIPAVQSLGGDNSQGFDSWFSALKWMEDEIDKSDYDICIIGCGAYGLPLAAHVKRQGKKAVYLGGATQLLFGIIGKRWETHPEYGVDTLGLPYGFYPSLFNQYWIRPGEEGRPQNAQNVEEGCYW